jgi:sigma-B regulation protein RsbU (phosphoserine phosphatase)
MNKIFYRDTLPSSFASMIYLELSVKSGEIHLVNAGHPPAFIYKDKMLGELPKGAQALGMIPEVKYKQESIALNSGEALLVYSDGLSEARNRNGMFFGEQKIRDLWKEHHALSSGEAGAMILDTVKQFTGDVAQSDDLSLIIIKRS